MIKRTDCELVQHFAYRESSHRRKGAPSHIIDNGSAISLAYPSEEEMDLLLDDMKTTCTIHVFTAPRGRGGGSRHPVIATNILVVRTALSSFILKKLPT